MERVIKAKDNKLRGNMNDSNSETNDKNIIKNKSKKNKYSKKKNYFLIFFNLSASFLRRRLLVILKSYYRYYCNCFRACVIRSHWSSDVNWKCDAVVCFPRGCLFCFVLFFFFLFFFFLVIRIRFFFYPPFPALKESYQKIECVRHNLLAVTETSVVKLTHSHELSLSHTHTHTHKQTVTYSYRRINAHVHTLAMTHTDKHKLHTINIHLCTHTQLIVDDEHSESPPMLLKFM